MLSADHKSVLILGGARSGKSAYGEEVVLSCGGVPHYIATASALDTEMQRRIEQHRSRRGPQWKLTEEPLELCDALRQADRNSKAVLVDCLTLWLSNLMHNERDITGETDRLIELLSGLHATIVFVSNEVGLGIVPENRLARQFRDHQGQINRRIASCVDRVDFVAAGLPLTLKS
uniref:bifunctional adenosylcobinamide kinase/adenosylcobinamide-phosphate guanylyltransferase n=1 Tax=Pararhizobium sp. IMCC3301 TaxID=3067904 RepID=UPI0027416D49|nr:bifunctional adenosylcobinamide kinase/adenosylcobinamide-phosphate guanylyltransferase [Pararhizobium sp. IMCC3301]